VPQLPLTSCGSGRTYSSAIGVSIGTRSGSDVAGAGARRRRGTRTRSRRLRPALATGLSAPSKAGSSQISRLDSGPAVSSTSLSGRRAGALRFFRWNRVFWRDKAAAQRAKPRPGCGSRAGLRASSGAGERGRKRRFGARGVDPRAPVWSRSPGRLLREKTSLRENRPRGSRPARVSTDRFATAPRVSTHALTMRDSIRPPPLLRRRLSRRARVGRA
jgi:hypothetical protein